jgi:hypothetical protein
MNTASISEGLSQRMWIDGKSFKVVFIENIGGHSSRKTLVEDDSDNPQVYTYTQSYNMASRECRWSLVNDSGDVVCAGVSF